MGVVELLSLLQEFDNPLQHPVIGLVFSAVYNEIKAQKSKKKKSVKKRKEMFCAAPFSLALSSEKEGRLVCKEAPEIGAMLQRKVGKLSSLS